MLITYLVVRKVLTGCFCIFATRVCGYVMFSVMSELFTLRGGGDNIISSLCPPCLTPFVLFMILMLLALRGGGDTNVTRSIFRAALLGFGRT